MKKYTISNLSFLTDECTDMFDSFKPGTHFEMDLMDRKAEVKRIIEDVINSMSDDEGEEGSEDEAEDNGKVEKSKSDPDGGEEK